MSFSTFFYIKHFVIKYLAIFSETQHRTTFWQFKMCRDFGNVIVTLNTQIFDYCYFSAIYLFRFRLLKNFQNTNGIPYTGRTARNSYNQNFVQFVLDPNAVVKLYFNVFYAIFEKKPNIKNLFFCLRFPRKRENWNSLKW